MAVAPVLGSRERRQEQTLWQRRFWEHTIRDEQHFAMHSDYVHYNPVKHGLCNAPGEWPFSSFLRLVRSGVYERNWGREEAPDFPDGLGGE